MRANEQPKPVPPYTPTDRDQDAKKRPGDDPQQQLPQHIHFLNGTSNAATTDTPANTVQLAQSGLDLWRAPTNLVAMEAGAVSSVGGSQPHTNMMPYLTISFCIALQGIFPSQT